MMKGLNELCQTFQKFNGQRSPSFADKIERNHEVIIQWSSAMPKLIEQIAILQTAFDELKTEKEALIQKNHEIEDFKKEIKLTKN